MKKKTSDYVMAVRRCFLFDGLRNEEIAELLSNIKTIQLFQKGEAVYRADSFEKALSLILDGELQVTGCSGNPKGTILNRLMPGDVCGVMAVYGDMDTFATEVTALKDSTVLLVSQEQLSRWFQAQPKIAENYIRFLTDRIRFLNQKIATYTDGQADNRVFRFLSEHCTEDGRVLWSGSFSDLARNLNIGRSSLYRSLDQLEAAKSIRREGKEIYLLQNQSF